MKITGGRFKNHPLVSPKQAFIRPTSEKLRQMVFNICQHHVLEARFLDVFAGTGAMGIEALSRGAKMATFIEKHPAALRALFENLSKLKLEEFATVLKGDAIRHLKGCIKEEKQFDLIFVDPPYQMKQRETGEYLCDAALKVIDTSSLLAEGGVLFLEEEREPTVSLKHLSLKEKRSVGSTTLFQYKF